MRKASSTAPPDSLLAKESTCDLLFAGNVIVYIENGRIVTQHANAGQHPLDIPSGKRMGRCYDDAPMYEDSVPNIYAVAKRAGVSTATVSRVLSRPDVVAPSTRRKVMRAVETLGYAPNRSE